MEKQVYFEVFLDWLENSRPFFLKRRPDDKRLIDLVGCFITPACGAIKADLNAFVVSRDYGVKVLNPFSFDCDNLPSGTRIVFSFQDIVEDSENRDNFGLAFLKADRMPLLSSWNIKSYLPLRLPRIYEPTECLEITSDLGEEIYEMLCHQTTDTSHLIIRGKASTYVVDLDNWGEDDCVITSPFSEELRNLTCLSEGLSEDYFFAVADGQLYKVLCRDWTVEPEPVEEQARGKRIAKFKAYDRYNKLYLFENRELLYLSATSNHELQLSNSLEYLFINAFYRLPDERFIYFNPAEKSLLAVGMKDLEVEELFELKHTTKYCHFCIDREGIIYLLEGDSCLMHVLLPADHRVCISCGYHCTLRHRERLCPFCKTAMNELSSKPPSYVHWLTLDLRCLGVPLGPVAVDNGLNIYICNGNSKIVAITLSRQDMWGEEED